MLTLIIVALFHSIVGFCTAFAHVVSHGIMWLILPSVARSGVCIDCSYERWAAYRERERQHDYANYRP